MDTINTEFLEKSLNTLKKSYEFLIKSTQGTVEYEIYRNSTIKCFEVTLEQSGKLLRKKLKPYFASPKESDKLNYKDLFREALKHSLIDAEFVNRWFIYRDNRNDTAHDYGEEFAEETVKLLTKFIEDAELLINVIKND